MINIFVCIVVIIFVWGFFVEPNLVIVKKYKINNFGNKKIVFISDFHISKFDKQRLKRIVKVINKQNPDLILSGGDFINGNSGKNSLPINKIVEELKKIKSPVITVLGNHDGKFDKYTVKKSLESANIRVLINSSVKIDDLYIAGVEDLQTGTPNIETALENTEFPRILLTHSPDIYYDIKEDVDLILAGHVHGGQVRIPFAGSIIVPSKFGTKFACGDYKETLNRMIVTKGLGTSLLNVRFWCLPEIIVFENI